MNEEAIKRQLIHLVNKEPGCHLKKFPGSAGFVGTGDLVGWINGKYISIEVKVFNVPKQQSTFLRPFKGLTSMQLYQLMRTNSEGACGLVLSVGLQGNSIDTVYIARPYEEDLREGMLLSEIIKGNVRDHLLWSGDKDICPVWTTDDLNVKQIKEILK